MTLTIELTPEQEARLNQTAQQQGKQPADMIAAYIDSLPEQTPTPATPTTWGAQVLAAMEANDVFGAFDDRSEDSPELARLLRAGAEQRVVEP